MRRWAQVAVIGGAIGTLLVVPLRIDSEAGLEAATAACVDGSCCYEENSDCIINNILTTNSYAKLKEGSCMEDLKPHG